MVWNYMHTTPLSYENSLFVANDGYLSHIACPPPPPPPPPPSANMDKGATNLWHG